MFSGVGEEWQIFSFAGFIANVEGGRPSATAARSGIARALSREHLISTLRAWGFQVTSVSAVDELEEAIGVMELIASRDPSVGDSDFISLLDASEGAQAHAPEHVFAFFGELAERPAVPYAGFATALSGRKLAAELVGLTFTVASTISLAEARALFDEMQAARHGDDGFLDLIEIAAN